MQQPTDVELPTSVAVRKPELKVSKRSDAKVTSSNSNRWSYRKLVGASTAFLALAACLVVAFLQWTAPSNIAGEWEGEVWKEINLVPVKDSSHWYSGTTTDNSGNKGVIHLEWCRFQGRFLGRRQDGQKITGTIALQVGTDKTLKGALTADEDSFPFSRDSYLQNFEWKRLAKSRAKPKADRPFLDPRLSRIDPKLLQQAADIFKAEKGRAAKPSELVELLQYFDPAFATGKRDTRYLSEAIDRTLESKQQQRLDSVLPESGGTKLTRDGDPVRSPIDGVVVYCNKNIKADKIVKKGTELIRLQSLSDEVIRDEEAKLEELEKRLAASKAKAKAYANNVASFTAAAGFAKQAAVEKLEAAKNKLEAEKTKVATFEAAIQKAELDLKRGQELHEKKIVSSEELNSLQQNVAIVKANLVAFEKETSVSKQELLAQQSVAKEKELLNQTKIDSAKVLYLEELSAQASLEKQVTDAKTKISKFTRVVVVAPRDGLIAHAQKFFVGKVVQAGDVIIILSPVGAGDLLSVNPENGSRNLPAEKTAGDMAIKSESGVMQSSGIPSKNESKSARLPSLGTIGLTSPNVADLNNVFESISRIKKEIRGNLSKNERVQKEANSQASRAKKISALETNRNELLNELGTLRKILVSRYDSALNNISLQQKRLEQAEARFNVADGTGDDVTRSKQALNDAQARAEQLKILLEFSEVKPKESEAKQGR